MATTTSFSILERVTIESNDHAREILDRLYRTQMKAVEIVACSFLVLVKAFQVRREIVRIGKMIGFLVIETDKDRSWCEDRSEQLLNLSKKIDEAKEKSARIAFSSVTQRLLDDAACFAEDASESLSLAASLEFKNLLEKSLAVNEIP